MRNKFILWLSLLIAFSATFHSCRTDLEATIEHKTELGEHLHQKISTAIFQKETFLSGVNDFKRVNNSSVSGKSSANSDYLKRFSIDESSIYKMDVNNTQTYALRAYNIFESAETVYNLVYRKQNNNEITFSIVKILHDGVIPVYDSQKGMVSKIDNPQVARTCTDFYSIELWHCKEGVSWSQCDKCSNCLSYSSGYTSYECGGGGGGGTGGGGTGGGSGGGGSGGGDTGGGGGGSGIYDPSGYTFDPNIPPTIEPSYVRAVRASNFFIQLNDQSKSWAVENVSLYCLILEFYLDHIPPASPPPNSYYWDLAHFAIQLFMEHPDFTWEQFYNQFINTPCEKIKTITTNNKFKTKKNYLITKTHEDHEVGFSYELPYNGTGGDYRTLELYPNDVFINFNAIPTSETFIHSHIDKMYPIFSPEDVKRFNEWVQFVKNNNNMSNPNNIPLPNETNISYTVVTSQGSYMLTFDGALSFNNFPSLTDQQIDDLNDDYKFNYLNNGITGTDSNGNYTYNMTKVEEQFLKFLDKNLKMNGLRIFRINNNERTELKLENNERKESPCP